MQIISFAEFTVRGLKVKIVLTSLKLGSQFVDKSDLIFCNSDCSIFGFIFSHSMVERNIVCQVVSMLLMRRNLFVHWRESGIQLSGLNMILG